MATVVRQSNLYVDDSDGDLLDATKPIALSVDDEIMKRVFGASIRPRVARVLRSRRVALGKQLSGEEYCDNRVFDMSFSTPHSSQLPSLVEQSALRNSGGTNQLHSLPFELRLPDRSAVRRLSFSSANSALNDSDADRKVTSTTLKSDSAYKCREINDVLIIAGLGFVLPGATQAFQNRLGSAACSWIVFAMLWTSFLFADMSHSPSWPPLLFTIHIFSALDAAIYTLRSRIRRESNQL